jgi:hypothetical protein
MNNEKEGQVEASPTTPNPQKVHLVKPPKRLNEMTDEERRAWAMSLGEALKKKFAEQQKDKD